jgi:tRNA splicing endonuclease
MSEWEYLTIEASANDDSKWWFQSDWSFPSKEEFFKYLKSEGWVIEKATLRIRPITTGDFGCNFDMYKYAPWELVEHDKTDNIPRGFIVLIQYTCKRLKKEN